MKARLIGSVSNASNLFKEAAAIVQNGELKQVVNFFNDHAELKVKPVIKDIEREIKMSTTGNILSWKDGMDETIYLYERL